MGPLDGKVAIITGGGRGLGEVTCEVLAREGVNVVCADVREDLSRSVADLLGAQGFQAKGICVDVSDPVKAKQCIDTVFNAYGRLDILVNGAAIDFTLGINEISAKDWTRVIEVNLIGPFLMSQAAFAVMKKQQNGHIVNIASTASKRTWANASAYHASKWGLLGLSHALHVEARQAGIKVTAVVAGGMRTPFLLERFPDIDPNILQDPRNVAETIKFVLSQPQETVIPEVMVLPLAEKSWP
jgi:NAD(P)-dependent dehydrogenase (short-subunit alcohol dehydrogenase family)